MDVDNRVFVPCGAIESLEKARNSGEVRAAAVMPQERKPKTAFKFPNLFKQKKVGKKFGLLDAAQKGNGRLVCDLCYSGCDVNARDRNGLSALHFSALCDFPEVAKFLIFFHADVNCQDNMNMTPLHFALSLGHIEVVKVLICAGASLLLKDSRGRTPEELALEIGTPEIQNFLQQKRRADYDQGSNTAQVTSGQQKLVPGSPAMTSYDTPGLSSAREYFYNDLIYETLPDTDTGPTRPKSGVVRAQPQRKKTLLPPSARRGGPLPDIPSTDSETTATCTVEEEEVYLLAEVAHESLVQCSGARLPGANVPLASTATSSCYSNVPASPLRHTDCGSTSRVLLGKQPKLPPPRISPRQRTPLEESASANAITTSASDITTSIYNNEKPPLPPRIVSMTSSSPMLLEEKPQRPPPKIPPRQRTHLHSEIYLKDSSSTNDITTSTNDITTSVYNNQQPPLPPRASRLLEEQSQLPPPEIPPSQQLLLENMTSATDATTSEYNIEKPSLPAPRVARVETSSPMLVRVQPPLPSPRTSLQNQMPSTELVLATAAAVPADNNTELLSKPRNAKAASSSSKLHERQFPLPSPRIQKTQPGSLVEDQVSDLNGKQDNLNLPPSHEVVASSSLQSLGSSPTGAESQETQSRLPVALLNTQDSKNFPPCNKKSTTPHTENVQFNHQGDRRSVPLLPTPKPRQLRPSPALPRPVSTPEMRLLEDQSQSCNKSSKMNAALLTRSRDVKNKILEKFDRALPDMIFEQESNSNSQNLSSSTEGESDTGGCTNLDCYINVELHVQKPQILAVNSTMNLHYDTDADESDHRSAHDDDEEV